MEPVLTLCTGAAHEKERRTCKCEGGPPMLKLRALRAAARPGSDDGCLADLEPPAHTTQGPTPTTRTTQAPLPLPIPPTSSLCILRRWAHLPARRRGTPPTFQLLGLQHRQQQQLGLHAEQLALRPRQVGGQQAGSRRRHGRLAAALGRLRARATRGAPNEGLPGRTLHTSPQSGAKVGASPARGTA